ncbi:hypothetical protein SAMN06265222_102292 [Neorhodopirellula lusitana]|uniref:Secreted protein n=1 Tax=Neorhodopirellula lusitana TaxID=445327 RepID=A0ABY1PUS9_9BACT|nr:hypothetical protein SAMN06265222_102292 [Neorhodopirellula lusitana]
MFQRAKNGLLVATFFFDATAFFTKRCCGICGSAYSYAHVLTIVFACMVDVEHRSKWNQSQTSVDEPWPVAFKTNRTSVA